MRIEAFGAFVALAPGVEGLLHVSELSHDHVHSVSDVVKEGEEVDVKVLSIDEDKRRISLSIKQVAEMADYTGPAGEETEPAAPKKKRKKPLRGGLDR